MNDKNMATVVRVKRRINEDPLEILFLSHKKAKTENQLVAKVAHQHSESVLKFAGRVTSKDACVSKHVREAIRKEKLEREYKQHQINVLGDVKQESRRKQKFQSQQSRFKITAKHRAIDLDLLDQHNQGIEGTKLESSEFSGNKDDWLKSKEIDKNDSCAKDTDNSVPDIVTSKDTETATCIQTDREKDVSIECECEKTESSKCQSSSDQNATDNTKFIKHNKEAGKSDGTDIKPKCKHKYSDKEKGTRANKEERNVETNPAGAPEKMFCLVDVEAENTVSYESLCAESNLILCNGVPLEKEVISERDSDESYVYDLYYTNSRDFDFRLLENDLTVEAFGQDYRTAEEDELGVGGGGEEDEDSNDEGNWRNDYPDDDPGFIDNYNLGHYGNDLDENLAFETETGNQLADWMSWRCNIENEVELSSDDEVGDYENHGKSYDAYYSRVRKEMEGDSDSDDLANTYLDQL